MNDQHEAMNKKNCILNFVNVLYPNVFATTPFMGQCKNPKAGFHFSKFLREEKKLKKAKSHLKRSQILRFLSVCGGQLEDFLPVSNLYCVIIIYS